MKHLKRLASMLLAMVMVLAMAMPVMAADAGKITVSNALPGKTYTIYKIFDQENYNAEGQGSYKVADEWKGFISNPDLNKIFVVDESGYVGFAEGKDSASDVAEFAKNALAYAKENNIAPAGSKTAETTTAETTTVVFDNLAMGYYLVDSSAGALCALDATTAEVEVTEKNDEPTVDKEVEEASASIGDTVNYKVTITAQEGAENYVLHDTMSKGLTFNEDVKVTHMRGTDKVADLAAEDYTVTLGENGATGNGVAETFKVDFSKYCAKLEPGDELVVTYSATINSEAEVTLTEENQAKLTYGNDHETETDTTETKNFSIPVYKFGVEDEGSKGLAGAEFVLTNTSYTSVDEAAKNAMAFKNAGNNVYFYNSDRDNIDEASLTTVIKTPEDGKFIIKGLAAGTYYLWETKAPDGYNQLKEAVTIVIGDEGKITVNDKEFIPATDLNGEEEAMVQVENKSGVNLPSTGGIGTTIFYIVGGVLVVGAAILLIAKKRAR